MSQSYEDISARLDAVERKIVAERVRRATVQSQIDQLLSSMRQRKQLSDHQSHIVDEKQLSDQQCHIAQPVETIQASPPATEKQPGLEDNFIHEAKKVNIMNSAQTDEAADTTAELTSVVKEAASSYVVQTVMASTAEPSSHAGGYVDSIDTSEPTSVANNAASRAQVKYTSTYELTLSVNKTAYQGHVSDQATSETSGDHVKHVATQLTSDCITSEPHGHVNHVSSESSFDHEDTSDYLLIQGIYNMSENNENSQTLPKEGIIQQKFSEMTDENSEVNSDLMTDENSEVNSDLKTDENFKVNSDLISTQGVKHDLNVNTKENKTKKWCKYHKRNKTHNSIDCIN